MNRFGWLCVLLLAVFVGSACAESRVDCATMQSTLLHRTVPYCVILPPGYDANKAKRYPVAYYLHGLGDNEQSLINSGGWSIYEELLQRKKIGEFIIVAPAGLRSFYVDSRNGKMPYEQFFFKEFMPNIEKKYRVGTLRRERGLIGISMGGFGALHYAFSHPQIFGAVTTHMAALLDDIPQSFGGDAEQRIMEDVFGRPPDEAYYRSVSPLALAHREPVTKLRSVAIRFDVGRNDDYGFDAGNAELSRILKARGVPHQFQLNAGRHNWSYVVQHFGESLEFLSKSFGHTK